MGLKYICRIHGLTPHSSTGRCPYELIKEGPLPSLFPKLITGAHQISEATAVRHSVGRLRNRRTFAEGDEVVVYDNKMKLSTDGKIVEVMGVRYEYYVTYELL